MKQHSWDIWRPALAGACVTLMSGFALVQPVASEFLSTQSIILLIFAMWIYIWPNKKVRSKSAATPSLLETDNEFVPFPPSDAGDNVGKNFWSRSIDIENIERIICGKPKSHIIVSGYSGSGKTIFLKYLLPNYFSTTETRFHYFDTFENIFQSICLSLFSDYDPRKFEYLIQKLDEKHSESGYDIHDVWSDSEQPEFSRLVVLLDELVSNLPGEHVIVLDQLERFIASESASISAQAVSLKTLMFFRLIERLRRDGRYNVIFSIRAESYFPTLALLDSIGKRNESASPSIEYFLLRGVNRDNSPEAIVDVRKRFAEIDGASSYENKMMTVLGLDGSGRSNTFLIQLYGYVVSGFYNSNRDVRRMVSNGQNPIRVVGIFINLLENDFKREFGTKIPIEFLRASLICLAAENQQNGLPVSERRLAAVLHIPLSLAERILAFLLTRMVVVSETEDGILHYRITHEVVADHAMNDEASAISPKYRDGILGLVGANRKNFDDFTVVEQFPSLIRSLFGRLDVGAWLIALFFIHGVLTINIVSFCEFSSQIILLPLPKVSCSVYQDFHTWVLVPHMLWLWYIFDICNGYFSRTIQGRILRPLSALPPIVGAILALLFAHYPVFMVVPIFAGGLLMGLVLVVGVWNGSYKGRSADESFWWGVKTLINMFFAILLTGLLVAAFMAEASGNHGVVALAADWLGQYWIISLAQSIDKTINFIGIDRLVLYGSVILMSYFWFSIKQQQQSAQSLAARLAIYDRVRQSG